VRFLAPAIGLLVLAAHEVDTGQTVAAVASAGLACAILVALWLLTPDTAVAP